MSPQKKLCPRCGQEAALMSPERAAELAAEVYRAPSLCAGLPVYQARLKRCASCAALKEGVLCAYCGCFVQFRARPKNASCPNPAADKWQDVV